MAAGAGVTWSDSWCWLSMESTAGLSTRVPTQGLSMWLRLFIAWWLGLRGRCQGSISLCLRPRQKLSGFLWPSFTSQTVSFKLYSSSTSKSQGSPDSREKISQGHKYKYWEAWFAGGHLCRLAATISYIMIMQMFLFLVYIPLFISLKFLPKPSIISILYCNDTYWSISSPSLQRAESRHWVSSDSRKLVYILDANLLWEEQQSFCASWCDEREASAAGWHPGILVLHCWEQCTDPSQHSRQ